MKRTHNPTATKPKYPELCKLLFLLCHQVIIFQTYTNKSPVPIEAKYVFPLEETAAVCGFEAFINGKHVIGKVQSHSESVECSFCSSSKLLSHPFSMSFFVL